MFRIMDARIRSMEAMDDELYHDREDSDYDDDEGGEREGRMITRYHWRRWIPEWLSGAATGRKRSIGWLCGSRVILIFHMVLYKSEPPVFMTTA